jgi:phage-related protein
MKIYTLSDQNSRPEFEGFLHSVSEKLAAAICKKLQAYTELGDIYVCNRLTVLNSKIWGYKGVIYKLRVDCGKESARVLFAKTPENDLVMLHGYVKKTRKTPRRDAKTAMHNLDRFNAEAALDQINLENYLK